MIKLKKEMLIVLAIVAIIVIIQLSIFIKKGVNDNKSDYVENESITANLGYDSESIINEWTQAVSNQSDLEKFIKKNFNYKAWYLWNNMSEGSGKEEFQITYDSLKGDDYGNDAIYNVSEKMFNEFGKNKYAQYDQLKLKTIDKIGKYEEFDIFDTIEFTIEYTNEAKEIEEEKCVALFYDKRIIRIIQQ